ncbi:MAG TPA: HlyD family efflux transporter periplasmic adaptor subunit [Streptosporangiaceae bacterium]|nr:HlyD family efflux transporter periplasmic adaptor subunit [Streptosporangiaceae bacterium]
MTRRPPATRFRRAAALGIAGLAILAGAGTAYATVSASGPAYRLASVTAARVTASLDVVGTLSPVQEADVPFAVSGTVSSVAVRAGQRVTAGQRLGSLSKASLRAGLTAAQSTLAQANLQISNDIASQDQAAPGSAAGPGPAALRPAQQRLLRAQRRADHALARARLALAQASQVCASPPPGPGPSATPSASGRPSPGLAGPAGSGSPSPAPTTGSAAACASAARQVLAAETALLHAQQAVSRQLAALSAALAKASAAGTGAGPGGPAGAAQLAADQATADADAAQVTVAEQNLADATLLSPISGTVVSVAVSPGTAASAGSTAFEIAGLGSYQVQTEVPVTALPALKVGQPASVQPDGLSAPLAGSVISIGRAPVTGSSPVTYPVTIGLTGQPGALHDNGFANVIITTGRSRGVSVPTSAVHYSGHQATVTVYAAGRARSVRVTVGTKGVLLTRITAGLTAGQQVVLADLHKPLPSTNPNQGPIGPAGGSIVLGPP